MQIALAVTEGPNAGLTLTFDRHDTFVVGRSQRTSARLPAKDPYLSRFHFLVEVNPPRVRVMDLNSHNGTFLNGVRLNAPTDLKPGDKIRAGHSIFTATIETVADPTSDPSEDATGEYKPESVTPPPVTSPFAEWTVPGYRIEREIGRGGMGRVYHAIRESDGQPFALKIIRPATMPTRRQMERFSREAAILQQLDHPGIVRFHESGEANGNLYFTMEFVPGTDGKRFVRERGPMPVVAATRAAVSVLQALAHAHAKGFVHRDVKPSNMLFEFRPGKRAVGVKLADFGLARVYEESNMSGLTLTGEIGGSPAFMPPEQILDFRNVGPAADVYGVAATLYYLLTGKFIFDFPSDPVEAFGLVLDGEPVPIRSRRSDVPDSCADAIHRGLAKEPAERFRSVEEMAAMLRQFVGAPKA